VRKEKALLMLVSLFLKDAHYIFGPCSNAVIPGINDMVAEMKVGQKVQAIIPPELAFGDKGICIENKEGKEECLVKPGSKLVYDIYLKKSSIPPP
jgi:FKBP-type peptidyl-prolyl cis-trans isomerase